MKAFQRRLGPEFKVAPYIFYNTHFLSQLARCVSRAAGIFKAIHSKFNKIPLDITNRQVNGIEISLS